MKVCVGGRNSKKRWPTVPAEDERSADAGRPGASGKPALQGLGDVALVLLAELRRERQAQGPLGDRGGDGQRGGIDRVGVAVVGVQVNRAVVDAGADLLLGKAREQAVAVD